MSLNETKQRFVGLNVGEVSLVDTPANEEEFVVVKSLQFTVSKAAWTGKEIDNLPDGAFLIIEEGGEKDASGKTAPRRLRHFPVKTAEGKVDLPHLRNALARIPQSNLSPELKKKAQAEAERMITQAKKSTDQEVAKHMNPENQNKTPTVDEHAAAVSKSIDALTEEFTKVAKAKKKLPPELEAKMKALKAECQKAMGDEEPDADDTAKAKKAAAEKGAGGNIGSEDIEKALQVSISKSGEVVITKGGKQFSGARMDALKAAAGPLLSLMKEVDPEGFKSMLGTMTTAGDANPAKPEPTVVAPSFGSSLDISKAVEAAVTKAVAPLQEKLAASEKQLEELKNTRSVSKALDNDPDKKPTNEKPVEKKGDFWKGVL